jgi:hypothetical protein
MTPLTTFAVLKERPVSILKWNESSWNVEVLHSKSGGGVGSRRTQNYDLQYTWNFNYTLCCAVAYIVSW